MKYSIKRQMMTVFVGLILFMIVVFMIVNGSFLEKYYISNKKSEFIKAYTMVQEGVENGTINSETPEKDLGRFTEKNNISIAVIDSEYNVVYTNVREKQMMVVCRKQSIKKESWKPAITVGGAVVSFRVNCGICTNTIRPRK